MLQLKGKKYTLKDQKKLVQKKIKFEQTLVTDPIEILLCGGYFMFLQSPYQFDLLLGWLFYECIYQEKQYLLIMTDILPSVALSKLFSTRIRNYLLFLQVANNIELICGITGYLEVLDILNFLSSSTHLYSFSKISAIEIRLLKAKVEYYEKPRIQPNFQTFIHFLQLKAPYTQPKPISQKLAKDHQSLKNFNKEIRLAKKQKVAGNQQLKANVQIKLQNPSKQGGIKYSKDKIKSEKPQAIILSSSFHSNIEEREKVQKMIKNALHSNQRKSKSKQMNSVYQRFQEVEYSLAKQDFQRRKMNRIQQQKELQYSIVKQELQKMAARDPCSREVLQKIHAEETQRIQKSNVQKLTIKPVRIDKKTIQKLKILRESLQSKPAMPTQSFVQKLITNFKGLIIKQ